eukprot:scaffold279982_cov14-Tisochrysis_lutea.AAC.1
MGRLEVRKAKEGGGGSSSSPGGARLYIASLGVLAPYRGYKVWLLWSCTTRAAQVMSRDKTVATKSGARGYNSDRIAPPTAAKVSQTVPQSRLALLIWQGASG